MIVIYSKDNCIQCNQAERLLKFKSKEYQVLKLDKDYTREDITLMYEKANKVQPRAFPIVTNGDIIIGDLNALKIAIVKGEL